MKYNKFLFFSLLSLSIISCSRGTPVKKPNAKKLAQKLTIADGHINYRIPNHFNQPQKASARNAKIFDFKKAKHGGLNAAFMAIHVSGSVQKNSNALAEADSLIQDIRAFASHHSDKYAIATSAGQLKKNEQNNKVSLCLGLEDSTVVGNKVNNIKALYDKGIRYIGFKGVVSQINSLKADTSKKESSSHVLEKKMIRQMNKVGVMIDVSGLADSTFERVLKTTKAPVIASHASVRYFTPKFKKNLTDSMMVHLAKNGGVMMINFSSDFINDSSRVTSDSVQAQYHRWLKEHHVHAASKEARDQFNSITHDTYYYATVADVADHIDYAANLMGIDHVGIGSGFNGFDGSNHTMPHHLQDVSDYHNLIKELINRGYTEEDLRKIFFGNVERVWGRAQAVAQIMTSPGQQNESTSKPSMKSSKK